jgi:type II secretory pathway component GspD/PulD (secretin)
MINKRKKLLTKAFTVYIACIFGLQTTAGAATLPGKSPKLPLRTTASSTISSSANNTSSISLKGGVTIDNKNQRVTLSLSRADVRQVLRMLADKAGKNIVIDDSVPQVARQEQVLPSMSSSGLSPMDPAISGMPRPVQAQPQMSPTGNSQANSGEITLDLVNVSVNKAFEYIMTVKQLTYWLDGNTIVVATNTRAAELGINKTEIKTIKIKYVDAQKVADFLNDNIFSLNKPEASKSEIVTSNPSTNELYVFGNNSDYELAKKVVSKLDVEPQMKTFNVNYANPSVLAQKICMTVFHDTESSSGSAGSSSSSTGTSSTGPTSVSQLTTVCSGESSSSGGSSGSSSSSSSSGGQSSSSSSQGSSSSGSSSSSNGLTPFDSPSYTVLADNGLNQITIYGGTTEQVNLATQLIKNFDKKEPQVYLEISIIELSEDGSKEFRNSWGGLSGTDTYNFVPTSGTMTWTRPLNSVLSVPKYKDLTTTITSIITKDKGRMLANPRIIASNNIESTVTINEQYVVTQSAQTNTSIGNNGAQSVTAPVLGTAGIELNVTPKISSNGYVTLNLEPSYSSSKVNSANIGLLKSRNFKSENVRIKDGETLVIAGLIQEIENNSQGKAPILADIPLIGIAFKQQKTTKNRSELIFMITPRIIKDDDNVESI